MDEITENINKGTHAVINTETGRILQWINSLNPTGSNSSSVGGNWKSGPKLSVT